MGYFKMNGREPGDGKESWERTVEELRKSLAQYANDSGRKFKIEGKIIVCQTGEDQEPIFYVMRRPQAIAFENFRRPLAEECARILLDQHIIVAY